MERVTWRELSHDNYLAAARFGKMFAWLNEHTDNVELSYDTNDQRFEIDRFSEERTRTYTGATVQEAIENAMQGLEAQ